MTGKNLKNQTCTDEQLNLFPEEHFQPYAARASLILKLCYLGRELLQALSRKYPTIRDHLYHQAVLLDLLLLCRRINTALSDCRIRRRCLSN